MTDIPPLCPFCKSANVERHYARQDGGVTWPGCLECEETRPLEEWVRLVEERRAG